MYRTFHDQCLEKFGCKVYKLSIDAGFTCPNRDGTLGTGGCIFCSSDGGSGFAAQGASVSQLLLDAQKRVEQKNRGGKYIAYFQSFTNTYAPLTVLKQRFWEAIAPEYIVGLAIGTRPDCLPQETVKLLEELNQIKPVTVELGLQTVHPDSITYIRRGYANEVYEDAVRRLKSAGVEVVTHIILGLPGETPEMMAQTTRAAVAAGTDGVKFHLLHVLKGTDLERDYLAGKFTCMTLEAYADTLKSCIAELSPRIVVHRITGDGAKRNLVAPLWSADKKRVLNYLRKTLEE
ncbi:MAG: TIGR01212 family radical SAM protein [Oscillospiraceae bacterium]|nr:TIGR01212 family radical SAM protein [Oscillospiraceae bacterium]